MKWDPTFTLQNVNVCISIINKHFEGSCEMPNKQESVQCDIFFAQRAFNHFSDSPNCILDLGLLSVWNWV